MRALLTRPLVDENGAELRFEALHYNVITTLDRDVRDKRSRDLWTLAKGIFQADHARVLNVHERTRASRPNVLGIYVTLPQADDAAGND